MIGNILFLCTGNAACSQMAEALLNPHAPERFQAYSAGSEPAEAIFPQVIEDPAQATGSPEEILAVFRRVREQLDERICEWLNA